eukprot:CAMPEP_0114249984 /NCGR_PEP_ID=MMETSP0058-20121206/14451_1 /TAXON_ID=36894 /ORGANISM="Pyramimonas parkeae, CCMP726" /LENGTH=270 /DNA_ID=CAMNT_0001363601 /DNA_START=371 /DNA_END=1183 /DNA_ORIENTATION=+
MKAALQAANIDTSDCFERSELEAKFDLLDASQKAAASDAPPTQDSASQGFRSRKERASGPEAAEAAPQDPDKNWSQDLKAAMIGWLDGPTRAWEKLRSDVASGAVANRVRVMLNSLDAQLGVGTKLNKARNGIRGGIDKMEDMVKLRQRLPPLLAKVNTFRETGVGRTASTLFSFWFIFSGFFWQCLTYGLPLFLLTKWLYPEWLANIAQDAIGIAQQQAQQQGPMGGRGGMNGGGMNGGMGGAPPNRNPRPPSYGDGQTIDVEAKVSDK